MFWKQWSWSRRILWSLGLGVVAFVILFPIFARAREHPGKASCQSNLKQIGLAIFQYTQDYDESFPLVSTGGSAYGWADALQPYLKSTQLYQCPQETDAGQSNPKMSGYTDYLFNAHWSGEALRDMRKPTEKILLLDGNDGQPNTDARYAYHDLPPSWREDSSSPLHRHLGTANYLFGDGHVKALLPVQVEEANRPAHGVF